MNSQHTSVKHGRESALCALYRAAFSREQLPMLCGRCKRKTKSYFFNHGAKNGGKENKMCVRVYVCLWNVFSSPGTCQRAWLNRANVDIQKFRQRMWWAGLERPLLIVSGSLNYYLNYLKMQHCILMHVFAAALSGSYGWRGTFLLAEKDLLCPETIIWLLFLCCTAYIQAALARLHLRRDQCNQILYRFHLPHNLGREKYQKE